MKKLILIIVSILAVAGIAYGTAFAMATFMPSTPKSTSVDVDTMPKTTQPIKEVETPTATEETTNNQATDVQIKNNLSQIATALNSYASNNRGKYPTTGSETIAFENNYLGDVAVDPITKKKYSISAAAGEGFTKVTYQVGYKCAEDSTAVATTSNRNFALILPLTSGKNYCIND